MSDRMTGIWVYLAQTPLLWLATTLVVYQLAVRVHVLGRGRPWLNPVLISVTLIVALLLGTRTPYAVYFDGAQFVHFLLGPATVALAIPLYEQRATLARLYIPILGALVIGSATAIVSSVEIARLVGASATTRLSMVPRSATTPIAMGVSEKIGGIPSLTAVVVILTGILGAIMAKGLLDYARLRHPAVRGFAIGLTSHGIGTARAFQIDEETGAFSGLAMALNGAVTAILAPLLVRLLHLG
jgi:predicted murein hydrolase (TIGR00659 family)